MLVTLSFFFHSERDSGMSILGFYREPTGKCRDQGKERRLELITFVGCEFTGSGCLLQTDLFQVS